MVRYDDLEIASERNGIKDSKQTDSFHFCLDPSTRPSFFWFVFFLNFCGSRENVRISISFSGFSLEKYLAGNEE